MVQPLSSWVVVTVRPFRPLLLLEADADACPAPRELEETLTEDADPSSEAVA